MGDAKSKGIVAIAWVPCALLALLAMWTFVDGRSYLGLFLGAVAAGICAPSLRQFARLRAPRLPLLKLSALALIILCSAQSILGHLGESKRAEERAADAQEVRVREAARTVVRDQQFFAAHKDEVLAGLDAKLAEGQLQSASAEAARYRVSDPDLVRRKDAIEAQQIKLELQGEASMSLDRRAQKYQRLAQLEPFDRSTVEKAKGLADQANSEKAKAIAVQETAATMAARKAEIDQQFSRWDGSNYAVETAVKRQMKNPDSYQHVETRYVEVPNGLIVTTTFRGTNSFNALVPQTAVAAVDRAGRVISLSIN